MGQKALAKEVGASQTAISRLATGTTPEPPHSIGESIRELHRQRVLKQPPTAPALPPMSVAERALADAAALALVDRRRQNIPVAEDRRQPRPEHRATPAGEGL